MRKGIGNYLDEGRRRNALCEKYEDILSDAETARDFFDAALGVQGMDFVCSSVRDGWFMGPDDVFGTFSHMINGKFTHYGTGYTSKMYYRYKGAALADTTAICIVESTITVKVPKNRRVRIYAAGLCSIKVIGDGGATIEAYGPEDLFKIEGDSSKVEKKFIKAGADE